MAAPGAIRAGPPPTTSAIPSPAIGVPAAAPPRSFGAMNTCTSSISRASSRLPSSRLPPSTSTLVNRRRPNSANKASSRRGVASRRRRQTPRNRPPRSRGRSAAAPIPAHGHQHRRLHRGAHHWLSLPNEACVSSTTRIGVRAEGDSPDHPSVGTRLHKNRDSPRRPRGQQRIVPRWPSRVRP